MPGVARVNVDMSSGHDACPGTVIITGSNDVMINGKPCAVVGSTCAPHGCLIHPSHTQVIVTGGSVLVNGKQVAIKGSQIGCGGVIVSGSSDVIVDG